MRELSLVFSNGKAVRAISARSKQTETKDNRDAIQEQRGSQNYSQTEAEMDLYVETSKDGIANEYHFPHLGELLDFLNLRECIISIKLKRLMC